MMVNCSLIKVMFLNSKKKNDKDNYLILHFVGDKNHTNSSDEYGRSYAFMAILEDHTIYKFYPEIPSIIIPSIFVIITAVLFFNRKIISYKLFIEKLI